MVCTLNSLVAAFDANGVLGVEVFVQDCGSRLRSTRARRRHPEEYYSCSGGGHLQRRRCSRLSGQVANPVASFATDNNGVAILQLEAVPDTGAATASGTLTFGIGTESNNALGASVTILTTNGQGEYSQTTLRGQ